MIGSSAEARFSTPRKTNAQGESVTTEATRKVMTPSVGSFRFFSQKNLELPTFGRRVDDGVAADENRRLGRVSLRRNASSGVTMLSRLKAMWTGRERGKLTLVRVQRPPVEMHWIPDPHWPIPDWDAMAAAEQPGCSDTERDDYWTEAAYQWLERMGALWDTPLVVHGSETSCCFPRRHGASAMSRSSSANTRVRAS